MSFLLSARHFCVGLPADTITVDEVTWRTSVEKEWNSSTYHSAVSELRTTIPVELNSLPHTPNPTPQDYTTGPYTNDKWGAWLKRLSPNQHRIQNMYRDKYQQRI